MKSCTKCKQEKDLNEYYRSSQHKDGYRPICKDCDKKVKDLRIKTEEYKRKKYTWHKNYQKKYPEKINARAIFRYHLLKGNIRKLNQCECCLIDDSSVKIEAHHQDYSKPLEVIWLCQKCHINHHNGKRIF